MSGESNETNVNTSIVKPSPEFEQHHIVTLKPVSQWNDYDKSIHLQHNRILQPGYSHISPEAQLELAILAKENWLTDIICPNVLPACQLNVAADLIAKFKVSAEDLNNKTKDIMRWISDNQPDFINGIKFEIDNSMINKNNTIEKNAITAMRQKYPTLTQKDESYDAIKKVITTVETERMRKKITHEILEKKLARLYPQMMNEVMIEYKPTYTNGKNKDYSFLGAAGSGKSTITKQFLNDKKKLDYITLATDDYRGVVLDEEHEKKQTDQVFIKTQDLAYSIKELIQQRLESKKHPRPNIILDCVSLESWHVKLLADNAKTVSTVACLNDISLVPLRVYLRALDEQANPSDKGRHIHTPSLLEGHASASARLLFSIPPNVKTTLYDTNVQKGQLPKVLAIVETSKDQHQIKINMLSKLSEFLAKSNVNINATFKGELYRDVNKTKYQYTFDVQYQADQILKIASAAPPFKRDNYDLVLNTEEGKPYVKITAGVNKELKLEIIDKHELLDMLNKNGKDTQVLKSIIMQMHWKNMETARENVQVLGKTNAEDVAIKAILPEIESVSKWQRMKTQSKNQFRFQETESTTMKLDVNSITTRKLKHKL